MTADQLVQRIAYLQRRIKVLRDDNQRLWDSREEWKRRHRDSQAEKNVLRKALRRARASRDMWRDRAPKPRPCTQRNVFLTEDDLERILQMPPR